MLLSLRKGDSTVLLKELPSAAISVVLCDPPYGLTGENGSTAHGYLGQTWDSDGIIFEKSLWIELHRILRRGGLVKVFGASRRFHRIASVMDRIGLHPTLEAWCYGNGFPKSIALDKAVDALVLLGGSSSRSLRLVNTFRPVTGVKQRQVSSGRSADRGESRMGVKANMERWLHNKTEDVPITTAVTKEAKFFDGHGTALKPAWEPVLVGVKRCS